MGSPCRALRPVPSRLGPKTPHHTRRAPDVCSAQPAIHRTLGSARASLLQGSRIPPHLPRNPTQPETLLRHPVQPCRSPISPEGSAKGTWLSLTAWLSLRYSGLIILKSNRHNENRTLYLPPSIMAARGPPGARGMGNRFAQFKLVLLGMDLSVRNRCNVR